VLIIQVNAGLTGHTASGKNIYRREKQSEHFLSVRLLKIPDTDTSLVQRETAQFYM